MAAYAPLDGDRAGRARLSRQRLGRARDHHRADPGGRRQGRRKRRARACADRGTEDRGETEGTAAGRVTIRRRSGFDASHRPGMIKNTGRKAMKLTSQQIETFNREGWLFLPELFSAEETDFLAREAVAIYDASRPEVWPEKSGAPRTAFAAHLYNEAFGTLAAHPRMIDPIEQIFGEKVYMHQFKINAKAAFTGDVWQWHQDYGTWKRDDGMLEPRAMNIAIFLDDVMPINGPLMLVPKSQHAGDLKAAHDLETTSYPLWTLDEETV